MRTIFPQDGGRGLRSCMHTAPPQWRLRTIAATDNPNRTLLRSFQFGSHHTFLSLNSERGPVDKPFTQRGEEALETGTLDCAILGTAVAKRLVDPAVVIGQVISSVRNRRHVDPDRFRQSLEQLQELAGQGNLSCRIVLNWVETRNASSVIPEQH